MLELRDKILHRRSPVVSKRPQIFDIEDGELAINYSADDPGLYFKDSTENGTRKIRKIGPIHVGPTPPNASAEVQGYPIELSNGECWIDTSAGEDFYILRVWNSNSSQWIESSKVYARINKNLDQFLNGEDGDNSIHTDGIRLRINNKTALTGFSSAGGNKLIINEDNNFANGVELYGSRIYLNGEIFGLDGEQIKAISNNVIFKPHEGYTFTTDNAAGTIETTFEYVAHGLFDGERIYVNDTLVDGLTSSPIIAGEYFVSDATTNTFKLKNAEGTYVNSTGNIYISYSPEVIIDKDRNIIQAGNFGLKSIDDIIELSNGAGQIAEKHWDVYHNPTNGNVRIFARVGNEVNQIETSVLTIDVESSEMTTIIVPGDPVYYTGKKSSNNLTKVAKADASDPAKMRAIGIANQTIIPGTRGTVTILGEVNQLDTSALPGALPGGTSNVGRVIYVGAGGGLTLSQPDTQANTAQQVGILIREDGTDGAIMVNHPSSFVSLPNLPEDYIWAGTSDDEAIVHRLSPTSFKRVFNAQNNTWTISLADNIEFGGYKFSSDENAESKIETKISTFEILGSQFSPQIVEKFDISYRSAKYIVQISGISSDGSLSPIYEIEEILVIHDGINVFITEYGTVNTYNDERLGVFDSYIDILSSEVVLTFQKLPLITEKVEIKLVRTSILV